jgi:uncharacterized paraquat-inducible protein A
MTEPTPLLRGCPHCGLVHRIPAIWLDSQAGVAAPAAPGAKHGVARCARCAGVLLRAGGGESNRLSAAVALAALISYPLGISLPVMRLEQFGHVSEASIWGGTVSLMAHGQLVVGMVVLICSIVIPVLKLTGLLMLTLGPSLLRTRHQARVYRWIEIAGRWGMIDVLLVAVLVAAVKLGDLVTVAPGPGIAAFGTCVVLSLLASACFNPHAIWEDRA